MYAGSSSPVAIFSYGPSAPADRRTVYDSAHADGSQATVTDLPPPTAVTPAGAVGLAGAGAFVPAKVRVPQLGRSSLLPSTTRAPPVPRKTAALV